jgi:hypothetical protein
MVELTILLAAMIVLGSIIAKIIDWYQAVLHGSFLARDDLRREVRQRHKR